MLWCMGQEWRTCPYLGIHFLPILGKLGYIFCGSSGDCYLSIGHKKSRLWCLFFHDPRPKNSTKKLAHWTPLLSNPPDGEMSGILSTFKETIQKNSSNLVKHSFKKQQVLKLTWYVKLESAYRTLWNRAKKSPNSKWIYDDFMLLFDL